MGPPQALVRRAHGLNPPVLSSRKLGRDASAKGNREFDRVMGLSVDRGATFTALSHMSNPCPVRCAVDTTVARTCTDELWRGTQASIQQPPRDLRSRTRRSEGTCRGRPHSSANKPSPAGLGRCGVGAHGRCGILAQTERSLVHSLTAARTRATRPRMSRAWASSFSPEGESDTPRDARTNNRTPSSSSRA